MPTEGVVDALWKIRRSVGEGGLLLDVHPQPRPTRIEVRTSAGSASVGSLDYSSDLVQKISAANQALALLCREGAFVNEQKVEFEVLHHLDSIADWQAYMTTEAQYYVEPEEALMESIHGLLDRAAGEIILRYFMEATRFRRLNA